MDKKVKIYVLIDPITLRVRYIGRTISDLKTRLCQHLSKAKANHDHNTHVGNWIRSLLKKNCKPYIRLLTTVNGWKESHDLERLLISKYQSRLVNHDDRGEGGLNKKTTDETKHKIRNTLKDYYKENLIKTAEEVFVYDFSGKFLRSYKSQRQAAKDLNIYFQSISKCVVGIKRHAKGYQFSKNRLDIMCDLTEDTTVYIKGIKRNNTAVLSRDI
jgi:hypothetical protein